MMGSGQGRGLWVPKIECLLTLLPGRTLQVWQDPEVIGHIPQRGGLSVDPGLPVSSVSSVPGTSMGAAEWWTMKAGPWMIEL